MAKIIVATEQLFGGFSFRFGERTSPLMYTVAYDPDPFDPNAPDFMIPGAGSIYKYDIAVYLPRSLARRLSEKAREKGIIEPDFVRGTLHSYLSSGESIPHSKSLKYVNRRYIVGYQLLIEKQDLVSLSTLASGRGQPRWQTAYEMMVDALK